ncbi:hypothetical protein FSPOR_3429 [Fusarium sporotrichioides]|uniref:Myb-like domain-containing protein n=1 Tax=Fusarium sporotrichioides TaxID=5514 RepID=A0A395SFY4_FUSSP|nr:hypothetical protein FSPOR_3429 [Fusarium sporotrichioides]
MAYSQTNSNGTIYHVNRLRPWQRRALQNGRTPLPEAHGDQRWLSSPCRLQPVEPFQANPAEGSSGQVSASVVPPTQPYRFWPEDEMRQLISLRNGGATWAMIYREFPDRTHEAIKQAYHKRRHAIERQMENETAGAATSSNTAGP